MTPDVGSVALGVTAAYAFWRWLKQPTAGRMVAAGFWLGAAELTKSVLLILVILWPFLWLLWRVKGEMSVQRWLRESLQLGSMLLLALIMLNTCYLYVGSCEKLGDYRFVSTTLGGGNDLVRGGNRFGGSWLRDLPVPLPRDYVLGIDEQKRDFERKFRSYLRGQFREGGWWYYYLYGLAVKVPLGTWLLVIVAVVLTLFCPRYRSGWRNEVAVLVPLAVILVFVSSQTGFSHHVRYVLPAIPFAFIWISRVAQCIKFADHALAMLVGLSLAWSVATSVLIYPHSLSYFNELVGGPRNGHAHLLNSNIDWGQDLLYLRRWLDNHPEAQPLHLAFFGSVDPRIAGIDFVLPAPCQDREADGEDTFRSAQSAKGWFAVSVNLLRGKRTRVFDGVGGRPMIEPGTYECFLDHKPLAIVGYSIYIYHIE